MDTLATLLNLLCVFAPLGGFCLLAILFGAFMIWMVRRSYSTPSAAEQTAAIDGAESRVKQAVGTLQAWRASDVSDLSTDWRGTWSRFGEFKANGTIRRASDGGDVIAFSIIRRGNIWGFISAATGTAAWQIAIDHYVAAIRQDGMALGKWDLASGDLLNANDQPIGRAHRSGGLTLYIEGIAIDPSQRLYDVILGDKTIGAINRPRAGGIFGSVGRSAGSNLVYAADSEPDPRGAAWLLALAIIEIAYYSVRDQSNAMRASNRF